MGIKNKQVKGKEEPVVMRGQHAHYIPVARLPGNKQQGKAQENKPADDMYDKVRSFYHSHFAKKNILPGG